MDRRQFIRNSAALALPVSMSELAWSAESVPGAATEIRMLAAGGQSGDALQAGYINPFTSKTGIKVVREDITGTPFGKLRAMVESGRIDSVLLEIGGSGVTQAQSLGLIEPLRWDLINAPGIFPESKQSHGIGYQYFSVTPAWRADAKPIATWADFWDVKRFPGKRSLPDIPYYTLLIALLADGVKPENLYPVDVERAYASLARIKDDVAVWWGTGAQAPQLMADNEIQYAAVYSGRVAGNPKLAFTYNQGLLNISYFVVPKGASEDQKLAAYRFLHELTLPENQAEAAKIVAYSGNSPEMDKRV
ncbi:MAG TPA: extracellular solute-binding protein, partial [Burkholderiaceae bacterium]